MVAGLPIRRNIEKLGIGRQQILAQIEDAGIRPAGRTVHATVILTARRRIVADIVLPDVGCKTCRNGIPYCVFIEASVVIIWSARRSCYRPGYIVIPID